MRIGDLICYNAAGMKHRTLGVVMDFDFASKMRNKTPMAVLIMWSVVGEVMPRQDWHRKRYTLEGRGIRSGDMIWHEFGDWIEVVNDQR